VGWFDVVGAGVSPKNDGPSLVAGVGIVDGKADRVFEGCCDGRFEVEGDALGVCESVRVGPAEGS
jgi:hypothetical protein